MEEKLKKAHAIIKVMVAIIFTILMVGGYYFYTMRQKAEMQIAQAEVKIKAESLKQLKESMALYKKELQGFKEQSDAFDKQFQKNWDSFDRDPK